MPFGMLYVHLYSFEYMKYSDINYWNKNNCCTTTPVSSFHKYNELGNNNKYNNKYNKIKY